MLDLLLKNGANVSCEIEGGLTLLHMAIYEGNQLFECQYCINCIDYAYPL